MATPEKLKRPVYVKPDKDDFFIRLHKEVEEKVLGNKKFRTRNVIKSLFLLGLYVTFYACILIFGNATPLLFLFYILSGYAMITLFINAFHDAVHGAVFRKPKYNEWFTYTLELFGSSKWLWTRRHISLHHPYPNIPEWDSDIKQSDIVRIFPNSSLLRVHKYQHIYMWLIYPLYTLNWLYIRDFRDFFGTKNNYVKRVTAIPKREVYRLIAAKIFNLAYLLFLPMLLLDQPWYRILAAWLVMHLTASMLGVIALVSTHVDEEAIFPTPDAEGRINTTWAAHQMIVTKDFSANSSLANFLFGGFTHHVAHHLFPGVGHTYYPHITSIIKRYAAEYNLPYTNYPFYVAIRSHFRMLKNRGSVESIFKTGEL